MSSAARVITATVRDNAWGKLLSATLEGAAEDVVGGVELVVGTIDDEVVVVLSIEEEVVGMAELVVGRSVDEVVGGTSVLGTEVGLLLAIELDDG